MCKLIFSINRSLHHRAHSLNCTVSIIFFLKYTLLEGWKVIVSFTRTPLWQGAVQHSALNEVHSLTTMSQLAWGRQRSRNKGRVLPTWMSQQLSSDSTIIRHTGLSYDSVPNECYGRSWKTQVAEGPSSTGNFFVYTLSTLICQGKRPCM